MTIIITLKALTGKADSMQEQMGTVSQEMELLRKKKMVEIKNTVTNKECLCWAYYTGGKHKALGLGPPPCIILPGTMFVPGGSAELSLNS